MADTTEYLRGTSFTDAQAANPTSPLSGPGLDAELDNVKIALDSTQQSLDLIQRDDGALANGIVTTESLAAQVRAGVDPATKWVTGTDYVVNNAVFHDTSGAGTSLKLYRCLVAHTSGTFSTDLSGGKWVEMADYTPPAIVGSSNETITGLWTFEQDPVVTNATPGIDIVDTGGLANTKGRISVDANGTVNIQADPAAAGASTSEVQLSVDGSVVAKVNGNTRNTEGALLRWGAGGLIDSYDEARFGNPGCCLIRRVNVTGAAVAQIDFDSDDFDNSVFDLYLFVLGNIRPVTDGSALRVRTSANGGSTFDSGASDYRYRYNASAFTGAGSDATAASTGETFVPLTGTIGNDTAEYGFSGTLELVMPHVAGQHKRMKWSGSNVNPTGVEFGVAGWASRLDFTNDIDGIRFFMSAGNIAVGSVITMWGFRKN